VVCRGQREGSAASRQGYGRARSWTSRCSGEHVLPVARICAAPSTQATTTLFVQTLSPTEWRRDARAWGVRSEDRPSQLDTVWVDAEVPFTEAERVAVQETWTQVMSSCRWVSCPAVGLAVVTALYTEPSVACLGYLAGTRPTSHSWEAS
jgi:hypothetical protein